MPNRIAESLDQVLLFRLWRLTAAAGSVMVRLCEGSFGITRREWRVLALLYGQTDMPPSAVAERVELDKVQTAKALTSLVDKKLLERRTQPSDRRRALVALTPAGIALYEQLMPQVQAINQRILSTLSDTEFEQFYRALDKLQASCEAVNVDIKPHLPKSNRHKS